MDVQKAPCKRKCIKHFFWYLSETTPAGFEVLDLATNEDWLNMERLFGNMFFN